MGLVKEHKELTVPGEVIAQGMDFLPGDGTYRKGEDILAQVVGTLDVRGRLVKIIPTAGKYLPQKGDTIIGKVVDINMSGWRFDINSAYSAMLPLKDATTAYIPRGGDLTKYFDFNEYVVCKITQVTSQMLVDLSMKGPGLRKLEEGRIINVGSSKVPRIIGKGGSMVSLIKQATDCKIIVGQNGVCWISGDPEGELLAVRAIRMVEELAHTQGLTDRMKEYLERESGKTLDTRSAEGENHDVQ